MISRLLSVLLFPCVLRAGEAAPELWPERGDPSSLDFANVIVPLITRLGCNAANCHGAALGQAGFKLSLFGNDTPADYLALTHELSGRRIDRAEPARSLFLRKPMRDLPHKGGRIFSEGSPAHRTLLAWAGRGFPARENDLQVLSLEAAGVNGSRELLVRARYSDGMTRDVTRLARFTSNDDSIALVDPDGRLELKDPGATSIMVRFAGHVAAVRVGKPFPRDPSVPPPARFEKKPPAPGSIDGHLARTLERLGLEPSGECADLVFIRRAHLDLIGTLPTPAEVRAFRSRPDRDGLVERLLERPEFDVYWGYRLGQLIGVSSRRMGEKEAGAFHRWLKERARKPWAETARAILTASGFDPPAAFYRLSDDPKDLAEQVGRVFLGARWQCAQCHHHPFERFLQTDYFGMAAMFARVRHTEQGIVHLDRGEITNPRTGKGAQPAFPDGAPGEVEGDRRGKLAEWVASRPQFREAFANRVWALLMGRGLVHPPDDLRASNPSSHPELLEELSRNEAYRTLPDLLRAIAGSDAYRRAGPTPANRMDSGATVAFSHALVKPLPPEVLVDAIAFASGVEDSYPGRPAGTRAIDLGDLSLPSYTLDVCGRNRPGFEGSLAQELHLLVGEAIRPKLAAARAHLLLDDRSLVEELYLRTLSRFPSGEEARLWSEELRTGPREEAAEDLLWTLLNTWEFMTCH